MPGEDLVELYTSLIPRNITVSKAILDDIVRRAITYSAPDKTIILLLKEYNRLDICPSTDIYMSAMDCIKHGSPFYNDLKRLHRQFIMNESITLCFKSLKGYFNGAVDEYSQNPSSKTYNDAMSLLMDIIRGGHVEDSSIIDRMVLVFGQRGELGRSFALVRTLREHNIPIKDQTYAWLISACRMCNDIESSFSILDEFNQRGIEPDSSVHNTLLYHCMDNSRVDLAFTVIESMSTPRLLSASTLFRICLKEEERAYYAHD